MRDPVPALAALALAAGPAAAQTLDCHFAAACIEAGLCTEIDRRAELVSTDPPAAELRLDGGSVTGTLGDLDGLSLFDGTAEGLRLLLGIAADGSARLMAMETAPLAVATYSGRCEES